MLQMALQYARSTLNPACLSVCIGKQSNMSLHSAAAATEYKCRQCAQFNDEQDTEVIKAAYTPALVSENNRLVQ